MRKLPVVQAQAIAKVRIARDEMARKHQDHLTVETTCRKGCASCCHHPIRISVMEGTLLYWYLRNNGLWTRDLKDRLEDHAKRTVGLSPAIWMLAEIPCPLLSTTKECKAYSARPFMCRTAFSSGDPDLCRPANFSLATPMVDRQDALQMFHDLEQQTHKAQGVFYWNMPISMAVLLGARIGEGTMTLSESEYAIFSAHLEAES